MEKYLRVLFILKLTIMFDPHHISEIYVYTTFLKSFLEDK